MDFDDTITRILTTIGGSQLSDTEKADCYAQLRVGLHKLVWPILISHIPDGELKDAVDHPETLTVRRYGELIGKALDDPATAGEIHTEVMAALEEIDELLTKIGVPALPPQQTAPAKG